MLLRTPAACSAIQREQRGSRSFYILADPLRGAPTGIGRNPGDTFCLRYMAHQAGCPRVSLSLIEESVMDNIAWLARGLADNYRSRDSMVGVASPPFCHVVTGRTSLAGHRTARQ